MSFVFLILVVDSKKKFSCNFGNKQQVKEYIMKLNMQNHVKGNKQPIGRKKKE